jgi:choline dehydrogenase-like flavoprotein
VERVGLALPKYFAGCAVAWRAWTQNLGGACPPPNGGYADVVAAGEFVERSAPRAASGGLFLLRRSGAPGSAHPLPLSRVATSPVIVRSSHQHGRALASRSIVPDIVGLMSSPEISTANAVRWRLSLADRRINEALELLRQAAAAPSYCGPDVEVVERLVGVFAQIRKQVANWSLEEQIRYDASRPHRASRGSSRAVLKAIGEGIACERDSRQNRQKIPANSR